MPAPIDITGQRFGRWTALCPVGADRNGRRWLCRCSCGAERPVSAHNLRSGKSLSCGCVHHENPGHLIHGMSHTKMHVAWKGMLARCENPNNTNYCRYGARGIRVCERWHKFANFFADMGPRPVGAQIDRINNDGNYEPGNCRWVTRRQNCNNQRRSRRITFHGRTRTIAEWAQEYGLKRSTLGRRIRDGWSAADAIVTPTGASGRRHAKTPEVQQ